MTEAHSTVDLLALIGRGIESFEASRQGAALDELSAVIHDIEEYLDRIDEDPLLGMAALDPVHLEENLSGIQADLAGVIDDLREPEVGLDCPAASAH